MKREERSGVEGKEQDMKMSRQQQQQQMAKRCRTDAEPDFFFVSGQQIMKKTEEAELVVNTCKRNEWKVAKQILLK